MPTKNNLPIIRFSSVPFLDNKLPMTLKSGISVIEYDVSFLTIKDSVTVLVSLTTSPRPSSFLTLMVIIKIFIIWKNKCESVSTVQEYETFLTNTKQNNLHQKLIAETSNRMQS